MFASLLAAPKGSRQATSTTPLVIRYLFGYQKSRKTKNMNNLSTIKQEVSKFKDPLSPGTLAKQVLIRGENKRDFFDFVEQISQEIHTSTRIEKELLKKYIFSSWKLKRMQGIERRVLNAQNNRPTNSKLEDAEDWGEYKKTRIRNTDKICINEEIKGLLAEQEKLERSTSRSLRQLRNEQKLSNPQKKDVKKII